MKAELKGIFSLDIEGSLVDYEPISLDYFGFNLRLMIGPKGEIGEESFDLFVCSPNWIKENYCEELFLLGHHYFIMITYNYDFLKQKVIEYIDVINERSWEKIANRLARLGKWEFEDY